MMNLFRSSLLSANLSSIHDTVVYYVVCIIITQVMIITLCVYCNFNII